MFLTSVPVSSGPWLFDSWQRGTSAHSTEEPALQGVDAERKLDKLVFRYILDTNARFQALKAGEGHVLGSQPQLQIADFLKDPKFVVDRKGPYAWEHVDIQFGPQGHPALKQPYVRQALITGINRKQIAGALYTTIAPYLPVLQSHMFKPFEADYRQNWAVWKFNQQKVINILQKKGCTGGPSKPSASNQVDLQLSERRQAVLPVLDHDRQPASRARLRDHAEAAQERGNSASSLGFRWRRRCLGRRCRPATGTWSCSRGSAARRVRSRAKTCTGAALIRTTCGTAIESSPRCRTPLRAGPDSAKRAKMLNSSELAYMVKDIPLSAVCETGIRDPKSQRQGAGRQTRPTRARPGTSAPGRRRSVEQRSTRSGGFHVSPRARAPYPRVDGY